jgi:hypothetical protein
VSRYIKPRPEPSEEDWILLFVLFGPFAYLARWIWRYLLREDQEQQGKHYKTSHDEGQQLPGRGPHTVDAGTDHKHDDQEEERDYSRHVVFVFAHRARAALQAITWPSALTWDNMGEL